YPKPGCAWGLRAARGCLSPALHLQRALSSARLSVAGGIRVLFPCRRQSFAYARKQKKPCILNVILHGSVCFIILNYKILLKIPIPLPFEGFSMLVPPHGWGKRKAE